MTTQDDVTLEGTLTSPDASSASAEGKVPEGQPDANQATQSSSDGAEQDAKGGEDTKPKLIDIVRNAVKGDTDTGKAEPQDASSASKDGSQNAEGNTADGSSELDDDDKGEDGKPLPFHKHPRWQQMKQERDELRSQAQTYQQDAEQFQTIQSFMSERNLTADEVGQGFEVMSLIKNDPAAALEYLEGAAALMRGYLGKDLTPELQQAVEYGEMTEERARQMSEAQAQFRIAQEREGRATQAAQMQRSQAAAMQNMQAISHAVNGWEAETSKRDLDYPKKAGMVLRQVQAIRADLARQGKTTLTPQEAVQISQKAYEQVNSELSKFAPKKPTAPNPSSSVSAKSASPARPNSLLEAARQGANMPITPGH